jgi:hypothetical protein
VVKRINRLDLCFTGDALDQMNVDLQVVSGLIRRPAEKKARTLRRATGEGVLKKIGGAYNLSTAKY